MKQKILFLLIPLLLILLFVVNYFQKQINLKISQNAYDNINIALTKIVEDEKNKSLALAIGLSKNTILRDSLIINDKKLGYKTLSQSVEYLKKYVKKTDIYSQVLTKDLFVFARSWDEVFSGLPLETYREDLKYIQDTKKPKVEIEVGRLISIKASVPIQNKDEIVGTLEIITRFDVLVDKLREYNLELIPLMDLEYMESAYLMSEYPILNQDYLVSNRNYNRGILARVNALLPDEFALLLKKGYLTKNKFYFSSFDMKNNKNDILGKFLVVSKMKNIDNFYGNNYSVLQSIFNINSTKEDIYNFVTYEKSLNELGYNKDKQLETENILETQLGLLSKKELIEYILNKQDDNTIRGTIK